MAIKIENEDTIAKLRSQFYSKLNALDRIKLKEEVGKMPLLERMKVNRHTYKLVYKIQHEAFINTTLKRFKEYKDLSKEDKEKLFAEFWESFLSGECGSILQFMTNKGKPFVAEKTKEIVCDDDGKEEKEI